MRRVQWLCATAFLATFVLLQGCMNVDSYAMKSNQKFANVDGKPVNIVTGVKITEWRWLWIPIYRDDAGELYDAMSSEVHAVSGNQLHLLDARTVNTVVWAIPPYFLFPMPSQQLYMTGVGAKSP